MQTKSSFSVILILLSINVFPQERTNYVLPKIQPLIIGQLTSAKGWLKNPEGLWISRQNRIPCYLDFKYKNILDHEIYSIGKDNFISYQLRQIKIEESLYYILIKKFKDGYYYYESINEDWRPKISCYYYIISPNDYLAVKSLNFDTASIIKIPTFFSGNIQYLSNETNIISAIEMHISKELRANSKQEADGLCIQYRPFKQKGQMQFFIYGYNRSSYGFTYITGLHNHNITAEHLSAGNLDWENFLSDDLYNFCYYETPINLFKSLFSVK
jgi:hypothetical protein